MKKAGFLCLNTLAHAMHIVPIAFELSTQRDFQVTLFVTTKRLKNELIGYSALFPANTAHIEFLYPSRTHRILRRFKKRLHPRVKNVIKTNLETLLNQDILVMTDKHMLKHKPANRPFYIGAGHGAGDRACGFSPIYKEYDYIFISGKAKWDRMKANGLLFENNGKLIGYPKFDMAAISSAGPDFPNTNPVVLYNPHFNDKESSWHQWGESILDYFLNNPNVNLIFAPHILLFTKKNRLPSKYDNAENIHIDFDSQRLSDMTYTKNADIYLGDVSRQVFVALGYKNRPCIFLNPHQRKWQQNPDFRMWRMGEVINEISDLHPALACCRKRFDQFQSVQKELGRQTFSLGPETAGARGAKAIRDICSKKSP